MGLEIFISHAHDDSQIARALVVFLITGVGIEEREIRSTSDVATGIQAGTVISDELRDDIKRCRIVLPLVTANSISREFVAFEIGAAWALEKEIFPATCGQILDSQMPSLLKPLLRRNISQRDELIKLGEDIGAEVFERIDRPRASQLVSAANDFLSTLERHG